MKNIITRIFLFLGVALFAGILFAEVAQASHFRYGHITWSRTPGTRDVTFTVTTAWRVSPFTRLEFGDGTFVDRSESQMTQIATGPDYAVWRYTVTHTYASDGPFTAFFTSCCRIGNLVNAANASFRVQNVVDLRNDNQGSPVGSIPVILQMVQGGLNTVPLAIGDPDNDPFTVRMSSSAESQVPNVPVGLGVSPSGVLTWNTSGTVVGQLYAVQVMIEEKHPGGTSGLVALDFIIQIVGGTLNRPPTCMLSGPSSNVVNVGQNFSINITGTDPDGGNLTVNHFGLPSGATLTPGPGSSGPVPFATTFSWTPGPADAGTAQSVTVSFTDPGGLQTQCSFSIQINALQPPPFTYPVTAGHICLPPFMVQDPSKTHYWWAKAAGTGNLEIDFAAVSVNPLETGNATIRVYNPSNMLVASANVVHPASGETVAPPIIIPSPVAGSIYRIEVNVAPLPSPPAQGARHYRIELDGAEQLGTNSPLQAQAEAESVRWGVNVLPGEPLDVTVQGGPEAPATIGSFEVRNPSGGLVTTSPLGTPVSISSTVPGMWTVTVTGLDHHVIVTKTSGADRGLYLGAFSDVLPPQIFVPGAISVSTGPGATTCSVIVSDAQLGTATAKDNCEVHITRTGVPAGNVFPVGVTTITYTATDGAGNSASLTQTVTVIDNTPPIINGCPQNIFAVVTYDQTGSTISWTAPTSSDNCSATLTSNYAPGATFPPGTTAVTYTATDPAGNTATCSFTVTVNRSPSCSATPSIAQLWPPNHKMVDITIQGVTDPDGDPVTITITKITQDEPLNTLGDGNTEPDGAGVGTSIAQVRAERSGTPRVPGNGRVYVITYSASDGRGGTCTGSVAVCVPHDQGGRSVCIDDGQKYNSVTGAIEIIIAGGSHSEGTSEESEALESTVVPTEYALSNAYPNPFNPSTTIVYDLPEATRVRLIVYDRLGREVAVVVDHQQNAGRHSIRFNAKGLTSGVYFYRIQAGTFSATKKLILIR